MSFSYYIPSETKLKELSYLQEHLNEVFKNKVISSNLDNNELTVELSEDSLINVISYLKDNNKYSFNQLTDITAVDYQEKEKRFTVVYHLLSLSHNLRIRIKINVKEEYIVPSICQYYTSSDWYEREVFDMFGIYFGNHPDLRRILTDYGFVGHPLRKDFPLTGYSEVIYDEKLQKVKYKEIEIKEPYRDFNSINSWVFENNLIKKS